MAVRTHSVRQESSQGISADCPPRSGQPHGQTWELPLRPTHSRSPSLHAQALRKTPRSFSMKACQGTGSLSGAPRWPSSLGLWAASLLRSSHRTLHQWLLGSSRGRRSGTKGWCTNDREQVILYRILRHPWLGKLQSLAELFFTDWVFSWPVHTWLIE